MKYLQMPVGPMENLSYLLWNEESGETGIIDPSWQPKAIEEKIKNLNLKLKAVLLTHAHPDHVNACAYFIEKNPSLKIFMHGKDSFLLEKNFKGTELIEEGSLISLGKETISVIHTPGHTPGSLCYRSGNLLFTGDTLFIGCCGRVDLPGSEPAAMRQSLIKISSLPDETEILPGHSYNGFKTTIKAQKLSNICFKYLNNEEDFFSAVL